MAVGDQSGLELCREGADGEDGAELPVSELAADLETDLVGAGHAEDDMSALARVIRARSGLQG